MPLLLGDTYSVHSKRPARETLPSLEMTGLVSVAVVLNNGDKMSQIITKRLIEPPASRRSWHLSARQQEHLAGYVFASPWLLGLLFFVAIPVIASIYFSFTDYQIVKAPIWIGLRNFRELFTNDPLFLTSLWNTVFMVIFGVPVSMVLGLLIALLLNQQVKGLAILRTIYYLPAHIAGVALAMLWGWILNPQFGVVSNFLWTAFHIQAPLWLGDPNWVKPAFIIMGLWGVGGPMIIWLAGLQGIPDVFYEAAKVDGATKWVMFRKITLPLLSPTTFFV